MTKQRIAAVVTPLSLLLLFLSLLFINGHARTLPSLCSPSSCGNLRDISYPFRLKTDPSGCGDPDYEFDCQQNKKVVLSINGADYYVQEISYGDQSIRLADVRLASNESCSLPQRSLSSDEIGDDGRFDIPIVTSSWATFANCSGPGSVIDDPTYVTDPCRSRKGADVYVIYPSGEQLSSEIKESCAVISTIPARFGDVRNRSFAAVQRILQTGFELDWSVGCRDCRRSGGSCRAFSYDITGCNRCDIKARTDISFLPCFDAVYILIGRYIVAPIIIFGFLFYRYRKTHLSIDNNIKSTLGIGHKRPIDDPLHVSPAVEMAGGKPDRTRLLEKRT
ncbi:hypothetical protein ACLOJK_032863 [Asimina triloba]